MSYLDRLREMKYISPSGQEFTPLYDDLSRTGGKKAPLTEHPGQNQGTLQDLGEITGTFPITCYIAGQDYDLEADRFWAALAETGPGRLVHPRWGNRQVLPTSRSQGEGFVEGMAAAVFTITFVIASEEAFEYPKTTTDWGTRTENATDTAADAVAAGVPDEVTDTATKATLKIAVQNTLTAITDLFSTLEDVTDEVRSEIESAINEITNSLDTLVGAPISLMESLLTLYRLPGRTITKVTAKIEGYQTIFDNLASGFVDTTAEYGEQFGLISAANLTAVSIAAAESTTTGTLVTRSQAGEAIEDLNKLWKDLLSYIESLETEGDFTSSQESLKSAYAVVTSAISGLVNQALNLPAERLLVLESEKPPLAIVYELYGDISRLDEFIDYNEISGDEILLLPRGREVRWYV